MNVDFRMGQLIL